MSDSPAPDAGQMLDASTAEDYLRIMRHELRTPVNHIIGYSEMLLDEAADADAGDIGEALRTILNTGRQLLARINASLDLAVSDPRLLESALAHADLTAALEQIHMQSRILQDMVRGGEHERWSPDMQKIGEATRNLRSLIDNGVDYHAVAADVHSSWEAPARTENEALPGAETYTLLVVEDNELNRDMLSRRLERLGYNVVLAENGREALETVRRRSCDLILLDIMMPELNGYQVLEQLKGDERLRNIPVIMLSALDELASVVRCIEMGAEDYLSKPFDPVLLSARIGACLEKKHLRDKEVSFVQEIKVAKKRADDLLHVVIPIGVALSSEKGYNRLLEKIVIEAMGLCNADGGSLYLRTDDDMLEFVILLNRSLNIAYGGTSETPITFPPLRMYDPETKEPNRRYVVTQTALTRDSINIHDAYAADGFDFSGTRAFDQQTRYRSTSFLTVPLMDDIGRVIGVLQLLNAQDPDTGAVVPFDSGMQQMIESLSALAAAALSVYDREQRLRQQIEQLQIVIDEVKRKREVEEIIGTDYFQNLQARARELRSNTPAEPPPAAVEEETAEEGAELDALVRPLRERERRGNKRVYLVGKQEIHAREEGAKHRQVALLIHGWSSSWYAMSPLMPNLSKRYRSIAVDLPGYGDSPPLPIQTSIAAYADVLAVLIRQITEQPVVLVGHSMGGMISLTLALRHPKLVERMVLLCPTISGKLSMFIDMFISPITLLERFSVASSLVARLEPQLLSVTDRLMKPASFAERTGITEADYHQLRADARRPGQGRVRSETYWAMRNNNLSGKLGQVKAPALVLWGMEDNTVPLRDASAVADEWPAAELKVIPKAGHWPQFEAPEFTDRSVRAFLSTPIKLLKMKL